MISKKIILILALVSVLLLTACQSNTEVDTSGAAFMGGTNGISVSFEPFSVMEEGIYTIFDTEDFPIEVAVKNLGEETVSKSEVRLTLLGPAHEDFSNIPDWDKSNEEEIEKISEFNPAGGEEIISFTPSSYAIYDKDVIGYADVNWNMNFDYDYSTYVIVNDVCYKGDITDDRVCEVQEFKTHSVSGAPITVTSVEEDTGGKGIIILKFNIQNAGTGEATMVGEEFDNRFSQVSYTIEDAEDWECKSGGRENEARLIDGVAEVICQLNDPLSEDDLYSKSLMLTIDYTYQDLIVEQLRIKESAE